MGSLESSDFGRQLSVESVNHALLQRGSGRALRQHLQLNVSRMRSIPT